MGQQALSVMLLVQLQHLFQLRHSVRKNAITLGCQKFTHNAVSLTCRTCTGTATKSSTNAQDITYELRSAKIQFKVPADNVARQNVPYGYKDGEVALYSSYDEVVVCSNQGKCNFDTGICTCEDGYTGGACNRKNEHI